jgi:hypothetical protein
MSARGGSRQKISKLTPKYCEICGYDTVTQKHRIHPGKEGGTYLLGNVIALCPNHHAEADRGLIPSALLYYIVQERIRRNGIEAEYSSYLASVGYDAFAGSGSSEEPVPSVPVSDGNAPDGFYTGAITARLFGFLFTQRCGTIPKPPGARPNARKSTARQGDGGSGWVYSKAWRGGRG